ncbi:dicarboxylate/amino acid:cation symporter [Legionella maceachernii]|uniref:C4-dicarboxylic acid, orotate and citrate transporter n=1 Tax=Legionella maceachernii TaxID=466 RepID=A0A0W0WGF0_9GAMM|nr:dicarboxylate/amino acid:cation symporter [Legionella maceachernii]KTD31419.1 C4-dicarboxylic acid, orotate and citrate transporter [Legionella maceachernii]SKA23160.1 aerobic C4-dicarboxylate transport protein [Legionella maceachernii]SUO98688.1 Aerobic C4-dicarboxylate transport protein [Legionella maceachernii]
MLNLELEKNSGIPAQPNSHCMNQNLLKKPKFYKQLYFQVVISILMGILLGHFHPEFAIKMKPLGDGFIKLIRMMIAPIIFTTVVTGIASMKDIKEVGRIGIKALIYFEVMTTFALIIGLLIANIYHPGAGLNIDILSLNSKSIANYTPQTATFNTVDFILNIIPDTLASAFTKSEILPVLFISLLFGFGVLRGGEKLAPLTKLIDQFSVVLFSIIGFIMKVAPIGAFGAMAYTIGTYGIHTLVALSKLLVDVYLTSLLFIFIVLGFITKIVKFSLWRFLRYIKEELFIVLGTSSSEAALPRMISKLEKLGCGKTVVGLVLPAGYTFNLDGTSIYLTIATLFIAQALNIDLTLTQQLTLLAVLLLTSKGAAAVTGGGFIVLAATLSSLHTIPVEGVVLLLGVDRFMSEARSLTNLIGNGVATVVIAKWESNFDSNAAKKALEG